MLPQHEAEEWAQGALDSRDCVQRCEYEEEIKEGDGAIEEVPRGGDRRAKIRVRKTRARREPDDSCDQRVKEEPDDGDDQWDEMCLQGDSDDEREDMRQEIADLHALLDKRVGEDVIEELTQQGVETITLRLSQLACVMDVLRNAENAAAMARQMCHQSAKGFEDQRHYFYRGQTFLNEIMESHRKKKSTSRGSRDRAPSPQRSRREETTLARRHTERERSKRRR